jgi:hypothetical protein
MRQDELCLLKRVIGKEGENFDIIGLFRRREKMKTPKYDSPDKSLSNEAKRKILMEYLGPFFVKPFEKDKRTKLELFFQENVPIPDRKKTYLALVKKSKYVEQLAQNYLLSFKGHRLIWKAYNLSDLVTRSFLNENIIQELNEYPHIIIIHRKISGSHKSMSSILSMILDTRKFEGKNTLVIAEDKKIEGMELEFINPFNELEITDIGGRKND